jgi:hypothetical protein
VACLARGRTATEAHAVGTLTTTQATIWITEILQTPGPPIACKPGCAWCCTIPAAVSPPEALLIAHHLRTTLAPEALAEVRARLQARVAQLKPLTTEQHAEAVILCALLEENRCMVYEARPVPCRAWTSPDPALCQQGQLRPWEENLVPQIAEVMDVAGATQIGVTAGLLCAGVQASSMELHVLCQKVCRDCLKDWPQA